MKTKVVLFISLLFLNGVILAQEKFSINGVVRCDNNDEFLSGVTVFIESLKTGTSTDENGYYELSLPQGSYSITFSFVGYISETKVVELTKNLNDLDVRLKTDNKMLDAVIISSTKKDANVTELKMSVQTIDMVRIKKIPALMGEVDVIK